jgi:hypothetical protein
MLQALMLDLELFYLLSSYSSDIFFVEAPGLLLCTFNAQYLCIFALLLVSNTTLLICVGCQSFS